MNSYRLSPTTTNGFGFASVVVGIAGFCVPFVGGVAAVVLGVLGIFRSKETHTGRGTSITGVLVGALSLLFWVLVIGVYHHARHGPAVQHAELWKRVIFVLI
jgi:hypothetical protein